MRKIIHKLFWAWDFDKEEAWLNEMASKGLALVSTGFCKYEFEECAPGEYGIQLEFLSNSPESAEGKQYISFIEETGAEYVGRWLSWVYFRKKLAEGEEFRLFSDKDSLISHLKKIIAFILFLGIFNIWIGAFNIFVGIANDTVNMQVGCFNLILGIFAVIGAVRLRKKRTALENERMISE